MAQNRSPALDSNIPPVGAGGIDGGMQTKKVKIILADNENIPPSGLFLSGTKSYQLLAGVEAEVPEEVCAILDDAVMDVPRIDPKTQQIVGYTRRLRFPYQRVG